MAGDRTENLLEMATTDPLTGIANRRLFSEIFRSHLAVGQRFKQAIYLLLLDIDGFKAINDAFGHNAGDRVLMELVGLLSSNLRTSDVFARWGGDEFVILLHTGSDEGAKMTAEHLRVVLDRHRFGTVGHLTCSFGIARVLDQKDIDGVIDLADRALYLVKQQGKNGIAFAKGNEVGLIG
jgi:diguanylate cyclase (GGDEF)-like protein